MSNDLILFLLIAVLVALGSGYYVFTSMTDTCDRIIKKCSNLIKFIKKNR
jgi:prefoldin subunit 5